MCIGSVIYPNTHFIVIVLLIINIKVNYEYCVLKIDVLLLGLVF